MNKSIKVVQMNIQISQMWQQTSGEVP